MYEKKGAWKDTLQITQDLRNEIEQLKRELTLRGRKIKHLEEKYKKLKKGKRVDDLERIVGLRDKEIKRLKGKL